jgi:hypothetical protein
MTHQRAVHGKLWRIDASFRLQRTQAAADSRQPNQAMATAGRPELQAVPP